MNYSDHNAYLESLVQAMNESIRLRRQRYDIQIYDDVAANDYAFLCDMGITPDLTLLPAAHKSIK